MALTIIQPNQAPVVRLTWKNIGPITWAPKMRLDVKQGGVFDTPVEGDWVQAPSVGSGQTQVVDIPFTYKATGAPRAISTVWSPGAKFRIRILFEGISGIVYESIEDVYQIAATPTAAWIQVISVEPGTAA